MVGAEVRRPDTPVSSIRLGTPNPTVSAPELPKILGGLDRDLSLSTTGGLRSLCSLLNSTANEALEERLNGAGLLNLLLQVGSKGGVGSRALGALKHWGREGVEGLIVARKILDDLSRDCVRVHMCLFWFGFGFGY